ncbi:MAG: hypothetical protein EXS09_20825 [Gemmataceae bacterium]|nr:hypothetical protein [Gemmataceae bacterium]
MGLRESFAETRFQALVLAWLETLPAEGWTGTSKELGVAIASAGATRQYVPRAGAVAIRAVAAAIQSAGWNMSQERTATARLNVFTRNPVPDADL